MLLDFKNFFSSQKHMWSACSASLGVGGEVHSRLQHSGEDMGHTGSVTDLPAGQEDPSLVHYSCFNLLV